jgi:tetratricopeptide (TPR) repeat protein
MASLSLPALSATALLSILVSSPPAFAHGELVRSISEVTAHLEAELRKPVNGHERAKLHLERGELYRLDRKFDLAARDYDAAERYEPQRQAIQIGRARMLFESGCGQPSREVLERFLRLQPGHAEALYLHAQVLVSLGWGARAVHQLDRALKEVSQPDPDHYLARAEILVGLGKPHLPRALAGLDEGMARLGPIVSLDSRAIDLELALGRHDRALGRIDRQAAATIRKDVWLARRADVLDRAGRKAQARKARQQALQVQRSLPPALQKRPATRELQQRLLAEIQTKPRTPIHTQIQAQPGGPR